MLPISAPARTLAKKAAAPLIGERAPREIPLVVAGVVDGERSA